MARHRKTAAEKRAEQAAEQQAQQQAATEQSDTVPEQPDQTPPRPPQPDRAKDVRTIVGARAYRAAVDAVETMQAGGVTWEETSFEAGGYRVEIRVTAPAR